MNRKEFLNEVVHQMGGTKKQASGYLDCFLEIIQDVVAQGENVNFVGFGSFKVVHIKERNGINPQTGESIVVSAQNRPTFTAGKKFKELVNKESFSKKVE